MDYQLEGAKVLVTAGAQGIGLAIAQGFVDAGANVHVCDVSENALTRAKSLLPGVTTTLTDVSSIEAVDEMFDALAQQWGRLDVLVNNAGVAGPTAWLEDTDPIEWSNTLAVNLTGTFLCARRAVPLLKAAGGGSIVNISSTAGKMGFPLRSPYSATKFGVIGLTQTWAMELGAAGIRVNAILPGVVSGERQERVIAAKASAHGISIEEMRARVLGKVSLKKMVSPEAIAHQILFICSHLGETISGQSLAVDGNVEHLG